MATSLVYFQYQPGVYTESSQEKVRSPSLKRPIEKHWLDFSSIWGKNALICDFAILYCCVLICDIATAASVATAWGRDHPQLFAHE